MIVMIIIITIIIIIIITTTTTIITIIIKLKNKDKIECFSKFKYLSLPPLGVEVCELVF